MDKSRLLCLAVFACALVSCSPSLRTEGHVVISLQGPNGELARIATAQAIDIETRTSSDNWYLRFRADQKNSSVAQLYGAEWGRELIFLSKEKLLADSGSTWARAGFATSAPAWFTGLEPGPKNGFIPTAAYAWGLFFNEKDLARLGGTPPASLAEFESMLVRAKSAGLTPIALGAGYGWPAAAWFTILDLRMNGSAALRERYSGARTWNDSGAVAVAAKLAAWRDAGYFSSDLAETGMPEAIASMESGQSLCTLMGAYAVDRLQQAGSSRFTAFPTVDGKPGRSEIAGLSGFALPREGFVSGKDAGPSPSAEASLALVSAYIEAGSPDERIDSFRLPTAYMARRDYKLPKLQGIKATELEMLKGCEAVLPSFDQAVSPQALQNSIPLWTRFFATRGMGARDFVDALQKDIEAGK
jgi:ABC-type glycerol-3-phosphate transport system substrate-binding protein